MLSIDEAIANAREVASRKFDDRVHCISCAEEHEQFAEWLEELKMYRESSYRELYVMVYSKAIDEFVKKICEKYTEEERKGNYKQYCGEIKQNIADIAEQLKEMTEK